MQFSIIVCSLVSCKFLLFSCKPLESSIFLGHIPPWSWAPYIEIFYFSNWISCIESINIVCRFHARELIMLPLSQLQYLYGSPKFQMLLLFSHLWYPGSSLLHTDPFWLHWSIACGLSEHMGASEVIATSPLAYWAVSLFSTVLEPLDEPCQFISDSDFDIEDPGSLAAIEWAATDAAALTLMLHVFLDGWRWVKKTKEVNLVKK